MSTGPLASREAKAAGVNVKRLGNDGTIVLMFVRYRPLIDLIFVN